MGGEPTLAAVLFLGFDPKELGLDAEFPKRVDVRNTKRLGPRTARVAIDEL